MPQNGYKFINSWCRQKYTGIWFSIAFYCCILELRTKNVKKKLRKNGFETVFSGFRQFWKSLIWPKIKFELSTEIWKNWDKTVLKYGLRILKIMQSLAINLPWKSAFEKTNFTIFYQFCGIFAALRPSFWYFYNFFQGFRSMCRKMWLIW